MKKIILLLIPLFLLLGLFNVYGYETNLSAFGFYPSSSSSSFRFEALKYTPYPVTPGDYFEIWVKVTNTGNNDMSNVEFQLVEEYPFSVYESDTVERNFGELNKNTQVILKYKVRVADSAIESTENLKIKARSDSSSSWLIYYLPIEIRTRQSTVEAIITSEPERIVPGEPAKINVKIQNTQNSLMRDINVKIDFSGMPFTPLNSINEKKINKLSADEFEILTFDIITDADAVPKPYKISLIVNFYDSGDHLNSRNYTMGLLIESIPEIQVDLEETKVYKEGDKGKITVSVSNIGPSSLKFLSLQLKESDKYDIISNPRVYLGNLNSDDYETAEFDIYSKNSQDIELELLVTYKNAYNEEFNKIETLKLPMYSKSKALAYGLVTQKSSSFMILVYILIVIFLYAVYKEFKIQKDVGRSFKVVILRWIKNFFNLFRPSNLRSLPKRIRNFFRQ
ncbi:MAG: hypothetical protein V1663_02630 [archaeon]